LHRQADFVLVAIVVALAVVALLSGQWLIAEPPIALSRDISPLNPRLFPSIVLLGIVAVGVIFIVNRLRGSDDVWASAAVSAELADPRGLRRLLLFLALVVICALALDRVGFLTTMFVLMVATSLLVGNDNLGQILGISIALPLAIYIVVTQLLRTSLPELDFIETALASLVALLPGR